MNDLYCDKCQKSRQKGHNGNYRKVNENKTKENSVIFFILRDKLAVEVQGLDFCDFRERRSFFSLDFQPFGPSVLDGARSKVDLCGEGYAWTPILWSFDNSKR